MQHWAAPKSPDNDAVMGREKSGRRAGMAGSSVWRLAEGVQQARGGKEVRYLARVLASLHFSRPVLTTNDMSPDRVVMQGQSTSASCKTASSRFDPCPLDRAEEHV